MTDGRFQGNQKITADCGFYPNLLILVSSVQSMKFFNKGKKNRDMDEKLCTPWRDGALAAAASSIIRNRWPQLSCRIQGERTPRLEPAPRS